MSPERELSLDKTRVESQSLLHLTKFIVSEVMDYPLSPLSDEALGSGSKL